MNNVSLTPLTLSSSSSSEEPPEALLRRRRLSDILKNLLSKNVLRTRRKSYNSCKFLHFFISCTIFKVHAHVTATPSFSSSTSFLGRKNVNSNEYFVKQTLHEATKTILEDGGGLHELYSGVFQLLDAAGWHESGRKWRMCRVAPHGNFLLVAILMTDGHATSNRYCAPFPHLLLV